MKRSVLKRNVPISKKGRKGKGAEFEREVMELSCHVWPQMRRNFMSGAQGGSDYTGTPGWAVEAKRHETTRPWEWFEQAQEAASPTDSPVVVFRRSRSEAMALLKYDDFLALVEASQL